jgi:hypothetical protein
MNNLQKKIVKYSNIIIDKIRYWPRSVLSIDEIETLSKNYKKCAILCKGASLKEFMNSKDDFDIYILVNFEKSMETYVELFNKISLKPVIIFSSLDELILSKATKSKLKVVGTYLRLVKNERETLNANRIRRRLEFYGIDVKPLDSIFNAQFIERSLQNTGLTSIYWASYYFSEVSIFGLDFFSSPYLTGKMIDSEYLSQRATSLDTLSNSMCLKFLDICLIRLQTNFKLHTYYGNFAKNYLKNLEIIVGDPTSSS